MESWQSEYIFNNLRDLTEYIRCSSLFVAELISKNVLSTADNAELNAEPNRLKQTKYLLDVLVSKKDGYKELLKALHETTQTGARDILLNGVLCNLKLKISGRFSLLKEYLTEEETKHLYRQLPSSEFEELYSCLIEFLENDKPVEVIKQTIPAQNSYYIPRILCKRLRLNPKILKGSCPDIFVLRGKDQSVIGRNILRNLAGENKIGYSSDQLNEITAQIILLEDIYDWSELQEKRLRLERPIHLIEYEEDKHKFILIESKGASNFVQRFIESNKGNYDITINEDKFISDIYKEGCKGVCICDSPGMGKTLLIENLARRSLKESKSIVLFIRLQHFAQNVHKCAQSEIPMQVLLHYVSATSTAFSVPILRKIMEHKEIKIDVFFDGFDEIKDTYLKWTEEFLKALISQVNFRVFVSSRSHLRDKLQNTLGVLAYDILPFSKTNQIQFLFNWWLNKHPKQDPTKLKEFANICLDEFNQNISQDERNIAGIPIICLLIAETYVRHACRYANKNGNSTERWISVGKSMFDIYKNYINTKFEIESSTNRPVQSSTELSRVKQQHYWKAINEIFPDFAEKINENVNTTEEKLDNNILSYGLLHEINNGGRTTYQFIHLTIAEFLVAECAVIQLSKLNDENPIQWNERNLNSERQTNQTNSLVVLLFRYMLATEEDHDCIGMSIVFANVSSPRTYTVCNYFNTIMYFLEHQFKQNKLSKSVYMKVWQSLKLTKTRIKLTQLMEICGYRNLVSVFGFVENVVLISPEIEVISEVKLCKTVGAIFEYSNTEFVKKGVIFAQNYFSFPIYKIVQVCKKNHWLTPLQYACYRRSYDLMDYFLSESCSTKDQCLIHICTDSFLQRNQNTHIRIDMIERLISIDPSLLGERDTGNAIPLLKVGKNIELMKFLIEKGSDILAADSGGDTIAHKFVYSNASIPDDKLITVLDKFLMKDCKGADNFKLKNNQGDIPMHALLWHWKNISIDALKLMLSKSKINVNDIDRNGHTLLSAAVAGRKSFEILNTLIHFGSSIDLLNSDGDNLLHVAAKTGNVETVKFLLSLGVKSDLHNKFGQTPLQIAILMNYLCCRHNMLGCQHKDIIAVLQNPQS